MIILTEQLATLDPSPENYKKLINLYISNKDYELANESLVYALATFPQNTELASLIKEIH